MIQQKKKFDIIESKEEMYQKYVLGQKKSDHTFQEYEKNVHKYIHRTEKDLLSRSHDQRLLKKDIQQKQQVMERMKFNENIKRQMENIEIKKKLQEEQRQQLIQAKRANYLEALHQKTLKKQMEKLRNIEYQKLLTLRL